MPPINGGLTPGEQKRHLRSARSRQSVVTQVRDVSPQCHDRLSSSRWESVVARAAGSPPCRWPSSTWWTFLKVGPSPVTLLAERERELWFLCLQPLSCLSCCLSLLGCVCVSSKGVFLQIISCLLGDVPGGPPFSSLK